MARMAGRSASSARRQSIFGGTGRGWRSASISSSRAFVLVRLRHEFGKRAPGACPSCARASFFRRQRAIAVYAAAQNGRHLAPLPHVRAGVLRVFEQAVPVALAGEALLICEHAGDKAATASVTAMAAISPPVRTKSPRGDLLIHALFNEALVHALVVAAHEHEMVVVRGETARAALVERLALRDM